MQYQEYKNKLLKFVAFLRKVVRFRILICAVLVAILALIVSFLATRGILYDVECDTEEIVYGEGVDISAKSLFTSATFEYRKKGGGNWTESVPSVPGEYEVRAVSVSGFGLRRYSDEFTFTILPKEISIKVKEDTIEYGKNVTLIGDTQYADKISCEEFIYGDYTKDTTTILPNPEKIKITNIAGQDVTSSYVITTEETDITFVEKDITVTVESVTQKYDGGVLSSQKYEVSNGAVIKGDEIIATFSAVQNGAGTQTNTPTLRIMNSNNIDVTEHYNIEIVSGTLTVEKRPLVIHTNGGEWVYDGENHQNIEYKIDEKTKIVDGHTITLVSSTTILDVGEIQNLLKFQITDKDGNDVTANYAINASESILKVTKRPITISTPTDSWEYDGYEHSNVDAIDKDGKLVSGNEIKIDADTNIIDAGSKDNEVFVRILNGKINVTKNYDITYEYGSLTITKRPISYLSDSDSRVYNAKPFKVESGKVTSGSLADNHVAKPTYKGAVTDCGTGKNTYEMHILDANGKEVTQNYDVVCNYGEIEVTIREITFVSGSSSHEYDGKDFTYEGYIVPSEYKIIDTHSVEFTEKSSIITVGTEVNKLRIKIYEGTKDKSANYKITYIDSGILTVTKRQISITANTAQKIYDAKPLKDSGYSIGLSGVAPHQTEKVVVEGSQTLAVDGNNTSKNIVTSVKIFDAKDNEVTSNYEIHTYDGYLTVNKRPIVFVSQSDSKVYDGTPLKNGVTFVQKYAETDSSIRLRYAENEYGLAPGENYLATCTGSQTNALDEDNSSENLFTVYIAKSHEITNMPVGESTAGNYIVNYIYGTLTVTKRPVIFVSGTDSAVYNGNPFTVHSFDLSQNSKYDLVLDHIATPHYVSSRTDAGETNNEFTVTISSSTGDVTGNYSPSYEYGKIIVTKRPVILLSNGATKVYDGTPIKNETFVLSPNSQYSVVYGENVIPTFEEGIKNVGLGKNKFTVDIKKANGDPSYDNYDIKYEYGDFEITHRYISVYSQDDTKKYDGAPLTNIVPLYDEGVDFGLAPNHEVVANITGTITFFGETKNTITSVIVEDENNKDVSSNYIITKIEGNLSITKRQITLTASDDSKIYDGTPLYGSHVIDGLDKLATYSYQNKEAVDNIEFVLKGSQTNVGSSKNEIVSFEIIHASGENATNSYEVVGEFGVGTLVILPREITITADSDSKVYDDTPLTDDNAKITEGTLAPNQTIEITVVGSITNVGTEENIITNVVIKDANGQETTSNYDITKVKGTLEITPRPVTFLSGSDTKVYDGTPLIKHTCEIIDASPYNLVAWHTYDTTYTGTITLVGTTDNTYSIKIFKGSEDVTSNYKLELKTGTLEITPIELHITTDGDTKVYDGKPLTNSVYHANEQDLPYGHTLIVTNTGSQTIAGSSKNTFVWEVENALGEDVSCCFIVEVDEEKDLGDLVVTKKAITISTGSKSKVYDGTPLTYGYWDCPELDELNDMNHYLYINITGTITNIGTTPNTFSVLIKNSDGDDVTSSFEITKSEGTLEVTVCPVTFQSGTMTTVYYTGQPFQYKYAELIDGLMPEGYYAEFDFTGIVTNVAELAVPNTFTATIYNDKGEDVSSMYEGYITYEYGILQLLPRKMEITAGSEIKEMDARPLYAPLNIKEPNKDFDTLNGFNKDYQFTWEVVSASGMLDGTTIGECETNITEFKVFLNGEEVSLDNFDITYLPGTIKIVEKIIYVNLYQIVGTYNGTPVSFEDGDYWYDKSQFPEKGYKIYIDIALGSMTEAGTLDLDDLKKTLEDNNAILITNPLGEDVTSSYEIVFTETGGITVNPRKIVIQAGSKQAIYNGETIKTDSYDIIQGTLLSNHEIVEIPIMYEGSQTTVGSSESKIVATYVTIVDKVTGEDVTHCYNIETVPGTLEIKPAN